MEAEKIHIDRDEARRLYRQYREHSHFSGEVDREIMRTYQLIAQGKVVIKALESIKTAGLDAEGLPKLAIARATAKRCYLDLWCNGQARFSDVRHQRYVRDYHDLPAGTFARRSQHLNNREAIVPVIPIYLRPKQALHRYHILWEADWHQVPRDPFLLRRIGKGDLWLVVAAWDLTDVERAALATRMDS